MFAAVLAASLLAQTASQAASTTRPTLAITYPTAKVPATSAAITATGTTKDTVAVTNVSFQLNGAAWTNAVTTNAWTNWTAAVTLTPGSNTLSAFAMDKDGTASPTNTVKFTYLLSAPLTVHVTTLGTAVFGTVTPNDNGKMLPIGSTVSLTAKPDKGFAFVNWSGSVSTNSTKLTFLMASNLSFTANFKDTTRPVLAILSPKLRQTVSNAVFTVTGKASDNVGVTNVLYQLNGGGWLRADTTNGWTNWMAELTLSAGTNVVQAFAEDAAGLSSLTNTVSLVNKASGPPPPTDWAPASLSGLSAEVTSTNSSAFTVSFGATNFSQTMLPGANQDNNAVGDYTYDRLSTNTALLTVVATEPPTQSNYTSTVAFTFTNVNEAVFRSTNSDGSVDTGAAVFSEAAKLAPASLAGKTIHATNSLDSSTFTTVLASATYKGTDKSGQESSGTYTYKAYSPVGAFLVLKPTSPTSQVGYVNYVVATFSTSTKGTYYSIILNPTAGIDAISFGAFSL
jgi:hypothetical protein